MNREQLSMNNEQLKINKEKKARRALLTLLFVICQFAFCYGRGAGG